MPRFARLPSRGKSGAAVRVMDSASGPPGKPAPSLRS